MEFAAHIRLIDKQEQSVRKHCEETGERASEYAKAIGLEATARVTGYLHDIGKYSELFNDYIHGKTNLKTGDVVHSFAGAKFLDEFFGCNQDRNVQKTIGLIGRVILTHHGPKNWVNDAYEDTYSKCLECDECFTEISDNFRKTELFDCVKSELQKAVTEVMSVRKKLRSISGENKECFAFYLGLLERFLLSCLIDADRTNTADFMSDSETEMRLDKTQLWNEMQTRLDNKLLSLSSESNDAASAVLKQRQSISDRCFMFAHNYVKICKLLVPTGGGKTLSSLRFAIEYAKRHTDIERIIYVAPFMSILDQNSDVISSIAGKAAFLEHYSDILAEKASDDEELKEYELRTEKWDSPVIATTMVQFFNSLFLGKSSSVRRMHRLSNAIIIIDEVQSIPAKCVYMFNLAMNFLAYACGSTIILCSATQPPLERLDRFPLMLDEKDSMTGDVTEDFRVFKRAEVVYDVKAGGYSYDEAADICCDLFSEHNSLLVVVNTIASAKKLYTILKNTDNAYVYQLSTNMCPQHRREKIKEIKEKLSKKKPVICVTTQLIEAGVDISFACVVRSLAGLDNIAQVAGRGNRNGEFDSICPVYVINIWEEELGSLIDIKDAQTITRAVVDFHKGEDCLGETVLTDYFMGKYLSGNSDSKLRYPIDGAVDKDMINLLSLNKERIGQNENLKHLEFCAQAFKRAGSLFRVIDSDNAAVIVPYNEEAKEIIQKLNSDVDFKQAEKLLKMAQKYSVSIYPDKQKKLENERAIYQVRFGAKDENIVQILNEQFYNEDLGIVLESKGNDLLMM